MTKKNYTFHPVQFLKQKNNSWNNSPTWEWNDVNVSILHIVFDPIFVICKHNPLNIGGNEFGFWVSGVLSLKVHRTRHYDHARIDIGCEKPLRINAVNVNGLIVLEFGNWFSIWRYHQAPWCNLPLTTMPQTMQTLIVCMCVCINLANTIMLLL